MARFPRLGIPRFLRRAAPAQPAPPPRDFPDSPENWAAGDVAECVDDGQWFTLDGAPTTGPAKGDVARVAEVAMATNMNTGPRFQILAFSRFSNSHYHAASFRKVRPHADEAERADAAFIATLKPARVPATAASRCQP